MTSTSIARVAPDILRTFCRDILESAGVAPDNAGLIVDSLVQADMCGLYSHGSVRLLPVYVRRLCAGTTNKSPNVRTVRQFGGTALLDGDAGPGQVVGIHAIRFAIKLAQEHGVGVVGVRNSSHFGTSAYFAQQALAEDMIAMVTTNAPSNMPPWGGRSPYFGTNPLCIALPAQDEPPVILDMSTSVVARGKIVIAAQNGETIPTGWAVDKEGNPTQDAQTALEGAVLPMGGYKGSGLALIIDALCGVLTGAAFGAHIVNLYDEGSQVQNLGHFFLALNIDGMMPVAQFKQRMDDFIREIRARPRMPGVERIYMPGEIEGETALTSRTSGIALPDFSGLDRLAEEFQIESLSARIEKQSA